MSSARIHLSTYRLQFNSLVPNHMRIAKSANPRRGLVVRYCYIMIIRSATSLYEDRDVR